VNRPVSKAQNVSRMCFVCGVENEFGLQGHFYELADGELAGIFEPRPEHQGYPGRMHGGLASAILDETIGRAINIKEPGTWGVTVEFTVRYRRPVPLDRPLKAVGRLTGGARRLFEGSGEIVLEDGTVAVEARGKYLRIPLSEIADAAFSELEWFADELPIPPEIDI
jgi:uncharacterized protein (TIGR00369 family)